MKVLKIIVFLFFLLSVSLFFILYLNFIGPGGKEKQRFVIQPGIVFEDEVIDELIARGFLKNRKIFYWILDFKGWRRKIEPGAYLISQDMNAYRLAQTLISGPYQKWVIVPPGKRKEQVALILKRVFNWDKDKVASFIREAKEGYLFPDSYLINVDFSPYQIFLKMQANFNEKFNSKLQEDLLTQNIRNDTAIKIASLVERESGSDEDKPIIAGIIWNRLFKEMRLEIDATVQYVLATENCRLSTGEPLVDDCNFWPKVTPQLLKSIQSPFNTYLNKGLPPFPIASPGLESIKAVVYPAQIDALYYLHSLDKQIHIAKTFKEHKENIKKYLK